MRDIKWENILALALALSYGLVIGIWCGQFFSQTGPDYGNLLKVSEEELRDNGEAVAGISFAEPETGEDKEALKTDSKAGKDAAIVSDKNGVFDVEGRRRIPVKDTLDLAEISREIDERAAYDAAILDALKITDNQELYEILDNLSDSTEIKSFGKSKKIRKKYMKELKAAVKDLEDNGYRISFMALDLDFGFGISKGAKEVYYSASAMKGPYVGAAVSQMPERVPAYEGTIYQVLKYSSNSGYETLRYGFGPEVIGNWYEEIHIDNLNNREHYSDITAVQFGKLWVKNWEFLTSSEEKAEWLKPLYENSLNSVMSGALADDDTHVYSKAGWIADYSCGTVQNDAGIIAHEHQQPYVMVVMSSAYMQNDRLERVVTALDKVFRDLRKK